MYLLLDALLYWVPAAGLALWNWRAMSRAHRRAFWIVSSVMAAVTFGMEYVYLWADIWSFSEARFPLIGLWIGKAPVEEFVFWWGATPFVLGLYVAFQGRRRAR